MTTYELAERLARRLRGGKLTELDMSAAMDVVEAINSGLQECYELLPSWQRRAPISLNLAAPATVSIGVTNGAAGLSSGAFTTEQIGRSVLVAGDSNWNEVVATDALLDAYQGSTGTRSAVVYGDSAFNALSNFDGFASHPTFADTREELIKFDPRKAGRPAEIGKPVYYWEEAAGLSLGSSPGSYLRFHPAPDRAYVLRVNMEFRPTVITYATMNAAATIPLADQFLQRALIPLCEEALMRSPEFVDMSKANLIISAAASARNFLSSQRQSVSVPTNRHFTPPGF